MEYCLIEQWHSSYILPPDCNAIALTPNASYQLKKCGIKYSTFSDFFDMSEIWGDTDAYLRSQLAWIKEFDIFVRKLFPEADKLNLNLPELFFINVKTLVDEVILVTRIINKFIDITKPSKIYFAPQIYGEDRIPSMGWGWFFFGKSSYFRLTESICKKRQIQYEEIWFDGKQLLLNDYSIKEEKWKVEMRKLVINQIDLLRSLKRFLVRYRCLFSINAHKEHKRDNVLIVRELYYTVNFYKDCFKNGFRIFFKKGDFIHTLSWLMKKRKFDFDSAEDVKMSENIKAAMKNLANGTVIEWINKQCGIDVSLILYSRFEFLLKDIFMKSISRIKGFIEIYKKFNIKYVVTFSLSTIDDFSSLAAARVINSIKSVGFAHGIDAYETKKRFLNENRFFDYYFVISEEEVVHVNRQAKYFGCTQIKQSDYSYFREEYEKIREKIEKNKKKKNRQNKPMIVFFPVHRYERLIMRLERSYSLQWDYFEWHYKLIDYFSSRDDYTFVWKSLLQNDGRADTIEKILKDRPYNNIKFSSSSIRDWLFIADKVICDIPSTAFYESIFCRLPVLAFYRPENEKLRPEAYHSYGKSLQAFLNIKEGIKAIEDFLKDSTGKYIIPFNNYRQISIAESLKK